MLRRLSLMIIFYALLVDISGCSFEQKALNNPTTTLDIIQSGDSSELAGFNLDDCTLLGRDGDTQYAWKSQDDDCVLYAFDNDTSNVKEIARFLPSTDRQENHIFDFGICGEWIIVSVGNIEGTVRSFVGDYVWMKKDGSELEYFGPVSDQSFIIAGDWLYYNYWDSHNNSTDIDGCYRIQPGTTDKEYLGNIVHEIYLYAKDGYLYGNQKIDEMINGWNSIVDLVRWKPDSSEVTTLFKGEGLPKFDDADYIKYYDIKIKDDKIFFTAVVHGYSEGDSWRGHNLYAADYCVDSSGDNLVLLNEER